MLVIFSCSHGVLTQFNNQNTSILLDDRFDYLILSEKFPSDTLPIFIKVSSGECWHSDSFHQQMQRLLQIKNQKVFPSDDLVSDNEILDHLDIHDDEEESPFFAGFTQALKQKFTELKHSMSYFQSPSFQSLFQRRHWRSWAQSTFSSYTFLFRRRDKSSKSLLNSVTNGNIETRVYALSAAFTLPLMMFSPVATIEEEMKNFCRRWPWDLTYSKQHFSPPIPLLPALFQISIPPSNDLDTSFATGTAFEICISYGINRLTWSIRRRFIDFLKLHALLTLRQLQGRLGVLPPFPFHVAYKLGDSKSRMPWPPFKGTFLSTPESLNIARRKALEVYLQLLVKALHMRPSIVELAEFLEISSFSLQNLKSTQTKEKNKEGYLKITTTATDELISASMTKSVIVSLFKFLWSKFTSWPLFVGERRWVCIKEDERVLIILEDITSRNPLKVIFIDDQVASSLIFERSRLPPFSKRPATSLSASSVTLVVWNDKINFSEIVSGAPFSYWIPSFSKLAIQTQSILLKYPNQHIIWYIDAASYFSSLADVLEAAEKEIMIMGWWVSPELFLRRPAEKYPDSRLDLLLKKKADSGVMIYILIFKEWSWALYLNSRHTKDSLEALSPRILVQRHPDHLPPTYWAHHEKLVIVDGKIAFLGGLDLCFGRYDDQRHLLSESTLHTSACPTELIFTKESISFQKPETSSSNINQYLLDDADLSNQDILLNQNILEIQGDSSEANTLVNNSYLINGDDVLYDHEKIGLSKPSTIADTVKENFLYENGIQLTANLTHWLGQDYYNPRYCDFRNVHQYGSTLVDRFTIPRMPWHDVHLRLEGSIVPHNLYRFFCERWNFVKWTKSMHRSESLPWLFPFSSSSFPTLDSYLNSNVSVTFLRSCGSWSAGVSASDCSILHAYLELIEKAEKFIYIENQFFISNSRIEILESSLKKSKSFISQVGIESRNPLNPIASAIAKRIERAFAEGDSTFRVIIIIPLLPAFEFDLYMSSAASLRIILDAQLKSLRNLKDRLVSKGIPVDRHLSIFSLRTNGKIGNEKVSEQIYVHSKVLIVDDKWAVVGSPNINDRSMLGGRDSEIALLVEDESCVSNLRLELLSEHLGTINLSDTLDILKIDPSYPLNDDYFYYNVLREIALKNTIFYREQFAAIPDDSISTWDDYKSFIERQYKIITTVENINSTTSVPVLQYCSQGSLVFFPLNFMLKEDLSAISWRSPEYLLPYEVFS